MKLLMAEQRMKSQLYFCLPCHGLTRTCLHVFKESITLIWLTNTVCIAFQMGKSDFF